MEKIKNSQIHSKKEKIPFRKSMKDTSRHFTEKEMHCAELSCTILSDSLSLKAPLFMGTFKERILEWAAVSSSRGSPQPRDQTQASRIAAQ